MWSPLARAVGAALLAAALVGCTAEPSDVPAPSVGTSPEAAPSETATGAEPAAPVEPTRDVGVQLFQWTWDSIAAECTDHLGPAGYGWVLTSPPQEHVLGEEWWTAYQPVSYLLESRLGTREEFAAMVATCADAGVAIVADAVINHMTGQDVPGVGWAGSAYQHYEYPGLYGVDDFHHCGLTPNDDIARYDDLAQVTTCELVNLADLDTASPTVRASIVGYLEDLLSLGVAGFRIDAAKHMVPQDVAAIVAELPAGTVILQEVIGAAGEPTVPADYTGHGKVFDFAYGKDLMGVVGGGFLPRYDTIADNPLALPPADQVVFVENHDTERNGSTYSYKDGEDDVLATVLMLATGEGTPVVYSGYGFITRDTGPLQDATGAVLDATCLDEPPVANRYPEGQFVCQHRWPAVAGMVGWRNTVGTAPVTDVWSERRVLAIDRGGVGFIVTNGGAAASEQTLATSLPPGEYCDVVTGGVADGACVGTAVTVADDGTIAVTVPPDAAIALHVGVTAG